MLTLQDVAVLAGIPHFSGVPLDDVSRLGAVLRIVEYPDGATLIREGDEDDGIVIVLAGTVRVSSGHGLHEKELNRLGAGEMLGLLALLDSAPRSATCTAVGTVRAATLTRHGWRDVSAQSPRLGLSFHRALGVQLARDYRNVAARLEADTVAAAVAHTRAASLGADGSDADCDVAVLGAGPLGMMYAQWLRRMHPGSRVVILERREVPGYKIGESTLSTTVRSFLEMGFTMPQLRRLFGNKTGIRFWWMGPQSEQPEREADIVDLEETFQIERRVFEMALQRLTREAGVDLRLGTQVDIERCELNGTVKRLACTGPRGEYTLSARIICDATGPAAVLPRHLGVYRKDPALHDTFQTNCYFGYFRQKKPVPLARWQDPATRHLCTPQGWLWFITVHSWESADDATMAALVDDVMDHRSEDDADLPSRRAFAQRHGAEFSLLTSIGITVREDMDTALELPIQARFEHYVQRYPALAWILEHYELVDQPYREKRRPYAAFLGLAHDSTQVAGDGWVAIGDSAQFSNPLFSHGLNYGTGTAYMAAKCSARALASGNVTRESFAPYEKYAADVYPVLLRETDFYYRSWAHPDGFEQTLLAKFHFGALDVTQRGRYSETDPWVFDLLNPAWTGLIDRVREVEKRGEATNDPEGMAAAIVALVEPFNAECRQKAAALGFRFGGVFTNHDDDGRRRQGRDKPRAFFKGYQCASCTLWMDDTLARCPVCATPNPQPFEATNLVGPLKGGAPVVPVHGADGPPRAAATEPEAQRVTPVAALAAPAVSSAGRAMNDKRRFRQLRVAHIRQETAAARSIVFEIPPEDRASFAHVAGQFLTLRVAVDGDVLTRCYSLSNAAGTGEPPTVTVKRVPGGQVSSWLCEQLAVGDHLDVLPPDGRFTVPDRPGDLVLFAAGSGITPIWSIAQAALAGSDRQVRLVYVNRSREESILADSLHALARRFGPRFKLIERVGRREGRLDTRDVQAYCDGRGDALFFVCGPWGFMDVVEEGLLDMGVSPENLHVERFASPRAPMPEEQSAPPVDSDAVSQVTVEVFGVEHRMPCAPGQTLTQAAQAVGVRLPSSCEEGYCGTCVCQLAGGVVDGGVDDALSKGQKKRGLILACQARPRSPTVRIRFD